MILDYLKRNRKTVVFYMICTLVMVSVLWLAGAAWDVTLYIIVLQLFVGLIMIVVDFVKYLRKRRLLRMNELPEVTEAVEREYVRMIEQRDRLYSELMTQNRQERKEMLDYYTLWAHQIKTPISAMHLLLQELQNVQELQNEQELQNIQQQNEQSQRELLQDLDEELFKINEYVEMVLSYLRLGSETTDYVLRRCSLEELVKKAVRNYAKQFIGRKIAVELQGLDVMVLTDEKWLSFVIGQLLSNALKYTEAGTISISCVIDETRKNCRLVIADTGIGIAQEDLPRIFEKGYTGYNGRSGRKSTGIGLYLCKMVLNKLGHSIYAESEIGVGTRMMVDLSMEEIQAE